MKATINTPASQKEIGVGRFVVDLSRQTVKFGDQVVNLSETQFNELGQTLQGIVEQNLKNVVSVVSPVFKEPEVPADPSKNIPPS